MTSTNGQGHTKTPRRIWLRVAGGGTTMPSMTPYVTMVGDDRPADHHIEYVRADLFREQREALEFYANPEIYKPHPHGPAFDKRDLSATARTALSRVSGEGR